MLNFFILILGSPLYAARVRVLFHINFWFCNSLGDYHFRFLLSLNVVSTYKNGLFSFFCWFWWQCLIVILVYTFNSTVPPIFFNNIIQLKPICETSFLDGNQENLNLFFTKKATWFACPVIGSFMIHSGCMPFFLFPSFSFSPLYIWVAIYFWVFLRMRFFFLNFLVFFSSSCIIIHQ